MTDEIIVDSNEPSEIQNEIRDRADFKVKIESLDQGDFLYPTKGVAIERKEGSDLASSIQDRRVKEQTSRMRAQHDHVYLIAERNLFDLPYSNIHENSITGQLISLAVKNGVRIIPTKNKAGTGYAVNRIFERHRDGEHEEQTEYLKRHDTGEVQETEVAILMQVDGVSEEKARDILEEIGPLYEFLYNVKDWEMGGGGVDPATRIQKVDGVGPKTSEKIINAFR